MIPKITQWSLEQHRFELCVSTSTWIFSSSKYYNFPSGSGVKNPLANAGDMGLIPGWVRSPGEENGNPLQYSCLENPMDSETWWGAIVHGVTMSWTCLSN